MNWGNLPLGSEMNCFWTDRGAWQYERCKSYIIESNGMSIKANLSLAKAGTTNALGLSMPLTLIEDGTVTFTYRKATNAYGFNKNGKFSLDIGFFSYYQDDDPANTGPQTRTVSIKKGLNVLKWFYVYSTSLPTEGLFAEILVFTSFIIIKIEN